MQNHLAYQTTREFLARVFPWPEDADADAAPGYLNIHWTSSRFDGQAGRACTTLDDAVSTVKWLATLNDVKDVYFCTTAQSEYDDTKSKPGDRNKRARRSSKNAVRFKALCLDIDAKGAEDNSYDSPSDAITALVTFIGNVGLPRPNVIVSSGGGFHVYWVVASALTRDQWQPLANALVEATRQQGLKCDTQCTIDAARILRVPETSNHKTNPPRPVTVLGPMHDAYSVERLAKALTPYMTAASVAPTLTPARAAPASAAINAELSAGIETRTVGPIGVAGIKAAIKGCGFLAEALTTGGKDFANPLWHQSVLVSAFLENGRTFAHTFSQGHPAYTKDETDNEFDRVERDIAQRGLGWPSCRAIHDAGCTSCTSCPHFGKSKSPLNLALATLATAAPAAPGTTPGAPAATVTVAPGTDLPPGYKRRPDGVILQSVTAQDGTTFDVALCDAALFDPWIQEAPAGLHFTTLYAGKPRQVFIELGDLGGNEWRKLLLSQHVIVPAKAAQKVNEFMTSWVQHLQNSRAAVSAQAPFGWEQDPYTSGIKGFAYAGKIWKLDGSSEDFVLADPVMARNYAPSGDRQVWIDACKTLVTNQHRPSLEVIVAASFGAPLVKMTGHNGLLMSAFSALSGIGKSTAVAIGQGVWASPVKTTQTLNDTENSLFNKIGQLRSLPMYWDEQRGEDPKKFVQTLFRLGQGKEKARLNRDIKQRESGTWQTILLTASNDTIADHVQGATPTTQAGIYRLFEFEVEPPTTAQIDVTQAQRMLDMLNSNYGNIGLEYAKFLATNYSKIYAEVGEYAKELGAELGIANDERFWIALISCVLMGARYANTLGVTDFHLDELKTFLVGNLANMREEVRKATVDTTNPDHVSDMLQRFLSVMAQRHTVYTNKLWSRHGRPVAGYIQLERPANNLDGIYVQIALEDKMARISSHQLLTWMAEKRIPRRVLLEALEKQFSMTRTLGSICAGTPLAGAHQYVYDIYLVGQLEPLLGSA